jgi:7-cyano-7-deazaguanine tRNA-ribosyltransferase
MIGDFEVKYTSLAARIGKLETRHGSLETPAFFPVIHPTKNEFSIEDLKSIKYNNFITNAYFIKKHFNFSNNIHDFFKFDGIIMTDSGAYQILEYGNIDITNYEIVTYQNIIRPDIAVILDIPTGDTDSEEKARESVEETIRRAKEAENIISDDIIWVYPIQGGKFLNLVEYAAKISEGFKKYKMLGLGSPTVVMEKYEYTILIDMIYHARSNTSRGKPMHLFGGGLPHIIPFIVSLGIDTFDSASYILYAKDDRYMTRSRVYRLDSLDYLPCSCPVCLKYDIKDLKEMSKQIRTKLLAIHNFYKILEEIKFTKQAIKEDRLFEYLQEKSRIHPALYSAFKRLLKYSKYLEKYDPRVRGKVSGIFLYDIDSMYRPELLRYKEYLVRLTQKRSKILIICEEKFNSIKEKFNSIKEKFNDYDIYIYYPFFGLIPINLIETYPISQHEKPEEVSTEVKLESSKIVEEFIISKNYNEILLANCENKLHIAASTTTSHNFVLKYIHLLL